MKNISLKSLVVFAILFIMQPGCTMQDNKNGANEKYNQILALQHRAEFLRHEGDIDSSLAYYKKSLALCETIEKQTDPATDTIYNRRIAHLNNHIGFVYDSLHNFDSALTYLMESLKWAKSANMLYLQISDEYITAHAYYKAGKESNRDTKELYAKGVIYASMVARNLDSLSLPEKKTEQYKLRVGAYALCDVMYKYLADSSHAQFYRNKYLELKAQAGRP